MRAALLTAGLGAALAAAQTRGTLPFVPPAQYSGNSRDVSLDEYRNHLMALKALVEACANARGLKNCDPVGVGLDDRVPLTAGSGIARRLVDYGWLRALLAKAEEADPVLPKPATEAGSVPDQPNNPSPPATSQLLQDADKRLAFDLAQISTGAQTPPTPSHLLERGFLQQVLAGRDFRDLEQISARDVMLEKLSNWLNQVFASLARLRPRSPWLGRAIVWTFILVVCTGLAWGLLQLERRWRLRLVPDPGGSDSPAVATREWQLWLHDAHRAAENRQWREAIHCFYWASISRLESRKMWPTDLARTPREYMAMLAPDDPRRVGLAKLTSSFERTWYGGHTVGEGDFRRAEQLAQGLIAGGVAVDDAGPSESPAGGGV